MDTNYNAMKMELEEKNLELARLRKYQLNISLWDEEDEDLVDEFWDNRTDEIQDFIDGLFQDYKSVA